MTKQLIALSAFAALAATARSDGLPEPSKNFDDLKPLVTTLAKADKVILHEGLPHPSEDKAFETEKKTKKTIGIGGWLFYAEPLEPKDEDVKKLTELLTAETTFEPFGGVKKCGGFHPDYAVEWHVGKDHYYALICFGCHEAKVYGPEKAVYVDIRKDGYDSLTKLLKPYRKNRPERGE
jgi:hypothetical protein